MIRRTLPRLEVLLVEVRPRYVGLVLVVNGGLDISLARAFALRQFQVTHIAKIGYYSLPLSHSYPSHVEFSCHSIIARSFATTRLRGLATVVLRSSFSSVSKVEAQEEAEMSPR